ncbi:hypothetical protein SASPL_151081 [Salvia splendens]|uniref:Uncharacterized protein n=1 Tax=Salvia splendens TaxID=180675 RepID=A0A8X8Z395_SALSN|nr:hypothetical protein SASPL_151081 [Salvia splendens]
MVSLASLGLRGDVRGACKEETKYVAKVSCNVQMHELDAAGDHVRSTGAREMVGSVHMPASMDKGSAARSPDKIEDHKDSWRDVVLRRIMKKKD